MDALSKRSDGQGGIRLVEDAKLLQQLPVALALAIEGDRAGGDLLRKQVDFFAEAVVDGVQDAVDQRFPGIAGQEGRDVGFVKFRSGLGAIRLRCTAASGRVS